MQTQAKSMSSFGRGALLALGGLALFCLGGAAAVVSLPYLQGPAIAERQPEASVAGPALPAGASSVSWADNGAGGRYMLQVIEGAVPAGARLSGVVASDTNCDPDAQGLSHCHDGIDLSDGRTITVVNTHNMARNECLAPGQRVAITRLNADWIVAAVTPEPDNSNAAGVPLSSKK